MRFMKSRNYSKIRILSMYLPFSMSVPQIFQEFNFFSNQQLTDNYSLHHRSTHSTPALKSLFRLFSAHPPAPATQQNCLNPSLSLLLESVGKTQAIGKSLLELHFSSQILPVKANLNVINLHHATVSDSHRRNSPVSSPRPEIPHQMVSNYY